MEYRFDFYSILAFVALVQLFILMVYLCFKRKMNRINGLLILFFAALSFDLFHYIIITTKAILSIPFFIGAGSIAQYLYGPTIYFIVLSVLHPNKKFNPYQYLHYLPFLINLIWFLSYKSPEHIDQHLDMATQFVTDMDSDPKLRFGYPISLPSYIKLLVLFSIHPIIYLIVSIRKLDVVKTDRRLKNSAYYKWLRTIIFGFLTVVLLSELAYALVHFFEVYYWFLNSFVIWRPLYVSFLLFAALLWPLSHKSLKHFGSSQTGSDFIMVLQNYMEGSKPYKNQQLSRYQLAEALEVSPDYLTNMINSELGVNFREFINTYRIQEVKTRIEHGILKDLTIEAVGNEAGFSSKSTFFRVFKDQEGVTPLSYAKQHDQSVN
ncbi:AraC family transcriptional regulator [Aquimarina spongiae]|nr:helix-turn-helix domain-containing protein [Aquimarina spongiae]